jgi:hypothetical protein
MFDYVVTGDREFAKTTKVHENWAQMAFASSKEDIIRCPALQKPLNGRKSENRYWPGTQVRFTCDEGYRLVGYENRRCREDGLWSWGIDPECITHLGYGGTIAGISLGILLPIFLILGCTIFCVYTNRRSSRSHYTNERGEQSAFSEWKGFYKSPANDGTQKLAANGNGRDLTPTDDEDLADSVKLTPTGSVRAEIPTTAREADV